MFHKFDMFYEPSCVAEHDQKSVEGRGIHAI